MKISILSVPMLLVASIFNFSSCDFFKKNPDKQTQKDTVVTAYDFKGPNVLDSLVFDSLVNDSFALHEYETQARAFYSNREWKYAWYGKSGLREHAGYLLQFLEEAGLEGVKDTFPALVELQERMNIQSGKDSTAAPDPYLEVLLTTSFFWYADKAWSGLPEEKSKALGWFLPRYHADKTEWLDSALSRTADGSLLSKAVFRQYYWLRSYLIRYDSLANSGGWPQVNYPGKTLRYGDTDSIVPLLSKSLFLHGDLANTDSSIRVDSVLLKGVIAFQLRHGLKADGAAGPAFFRMLNVPVERRLEQILLNMERSRWMPSDYPPEYLIVNIPDFSLYAYEGGKQIWTMSVVVGKELHETATFTGLLRNIVFNPYWVIPPSIVYKEIIPSVLKNSSYLRKHNMEIVDNKGKIVSSSAVAWSKYSDHGFPYTIRQTPGASNSLGRVKFLFPNSFSIYLHDTPSRSLFNEEKRAFSHGCIRLSDPEKLANYLLAKEDWTPEMVSKALKPGKEQWVTLKKKVPVYIVYFTSWVENDGLLHFRDDVYNRDEKLKLEMYGGVSANDSTLTSPL